MTTLPQVRDDLTIIELDGEAVVFDEERGELHHLNAPATLVLSLCDGSASPDELAEDIADAVGADLEEVRAHVREAIDGFRDAGLLIDSPAS